MLPRQQSSISGIICSCLSQPDLATSHITAWRHLIQLYKRTLIWVAFEAVGSTVWVMQIKYTAMLKWNLVKPYSTIKKIKKILPPQSQLQTRSHGRLLKLRTGGPVMVRCAPFYGKNSHGRRMHYKNQRLVQRQGDEIQDFESNDNLSSSGKAQQYQCCNLTVFFYLFKV